MSTDKDGSVVSRPVTQNDGFSIQASSYNHSNIHPIEYDGDTCVVTGDFIINDNDGNRMNVGDFMKTINDRLCVIQPNLEAMEEYAALKDAYDKYKMLEKLLLRNKDDKTD